MTQSIEELAREIADKFCNTTDLANVALAGIKLGKGQAEEIADAAKMIAQKIRALP